MLNLRTFDLNLLRVFEAISSDLSVSKAAEKLCLSQPAVSSALNRLRQQFNDPLFVRTKTGMQPTPKAIRLAQAVNDGLATIRAGLASGMDFDPANSERRFTLLMTDTGEIAFLPPLLSILGRSAPHIDLVVMESGLASSEEMLESGAADLVIGRIKLSDSLCSQWIHKSEFVVLLSQSNPRLQFAADGEARISFDDYVAAPHILVQPRGASPDPIGTALLERAANRRIALSIPHTTVLPMIIGETELIATVPKIVATALCASGGLHAVPTPFSIEPNHVYQWWHKRNSEDSGHRWLRSIFANAGV
ncbi:LysR family transcriptional regulator [Bradyrhizobium sp. WSM3983]|uniref:LysR family transcriptional regulator n=1 Tax=Bradyrhizobium sp. WSM3983 TaxID=1038867 RepID=UPI0018DD56E9|nr:LysR family transcriptional regulator [Bradyrhizobium sp. WSM3983]